MKVLAWPAVSRNPYVAELYEGIRSVDGEITVESFRPASSWRRTADLVHVHWPDTAVNHRSVVRATVKSAATLVTLRLLKARGAVLVWTCHNLASHERAHPRLERWFRTRFDSLVDGIIHLSDHSVEALSDNRVLASKPHIVAAHGLYRSSGNLSKADARQAIGLDPELPTFALVGNIRGYKNVPSLMRAFADMTVEAQLIVAGRSADEELRQEVAAAADGHPRILLDDRWLSDDELDTRVLAADAIVLPYSEVHNSGVVVLALGLGRPVAIAVAGSLVSIADQVGPDWVHHLAVGGDEPVSGLVLDELVGWASKPRSAPDLSPFDPDKAARDTVAFYRRIVTSP